MGVPTTVAFPRPLPAERTGKTSWRIAVEGVELAVSNLDKLYWKPEGYTKADLLGYYYNIAPWILPLLADRPITMKRMPEGADGDFFYAKQAPGHVPDWMPRAPVRSDDTGKVIDYLLAQDCPSLLYLANLGCIEMHPWHSRVDALGHPDYAFFDLDPFDVPFATTKAVARVIGDLLTTLGLRAYPRTSGSTGIHIYVPIDREHTYAQVREWVNAVCRLVHRADPERTTMEWQVSDRTGKVFLDAGMNTEGRNIAAAYSLRPERRATVSTPLTWDELATDVEPQDFTIETIWARLDAVGDVFSPVIEGGQVLWDAMAAVGMDVERLRTEGRGPSHSIEEAADEEEPGELATYRTMRDFTRTAEPAGDEVPADGPRGEGPTRRFVIQHHLATRLHHDLRLERGGTLRSWAIPKGLPEVAGITNLAVQTEDHPLEYLTFEGDIPEGEYGGGPMRIWDTGTYRTLEWEDGKVTVVLEGHRHRGEWHLFRTGRDGPRQWLVTRSKTDVPDLPPPPPTYAPMLAGSADTPFDDDDWLFEVKWDGVRAIATCVRPGTGEEGRTTLVSRRGNDITPAYPELSSLWERVLARNAVLDGEVVALGKDGRPSFGLLQQRMHLRDPARVDRARRATPVTYMVFDVLAVDGQPLIDLALTERLAVLDQLLVPGTAVVRSDAIPGTGTALFEAVRAQGLEGIVAKRATSRYHPGRRTSDWLKIKVRRGAQVVVGGWLEGQSGRAGELGSLLVGAYDDAGALVWLGRVGTGFDTAERHRLQELLEPLEIDASPFANPVDRGGVPVHWTQPTVVAEIEFGEVTGEGRLRAPSYRHTRDDLDPRDCLEHDVLNEHERALRTGADA